MQSVIRSAMCIAVLLLSMLTFGSQSTFDEVTAKNRPGAKVITLLKDMLTQLEKELTADSAHLSTEIKTSRRKWRQIRLRWIRSSRSGKGIGGVRVEEKDLLGSTSALKAAVTLFPQTPRWFAPAAAPQPRGGYHIDLAV